MITDVFILFQDYEDGKCNLTKSINFYVSNKYLEIYEEWRITILTLKVNWQGCSTYFVRLLFHTGICGFID